MQGIEWLDGDDVELIIEGPIRILCLAHGTRQFLQALYHCYAGFFAQGATTQPITRAKATYHHTHEDGILECPQG